MAGERSLQHCTLLAGGDRSLSAQEQVTDTVPELGLVDSLEVRFQAATVAAQSFKGKPQEEEEAEAQAEVELSGVPYFYLSPLQLSVSNLQENSYATLTMSLAQTDFCRKHGFDPQSPLCAHTILSGTVTKVNETEMDFAKHSLFIRHPEMKTWPSSHNWFFAKLNITNIWVLDFFGGPKIVTPEEYYNVTFQ
ncbi:PREDICTED: protein CREG1 [Galeopterus variegatus]|uniref:Protein CREG1 n=1 Tax=Galeopterus variegatus TaxID=482537 RepID=A0ABM0QZK8_GALVR|nr:PREDICTED: protein CREG1 [Galeopterus variegatus]